MKNYTGDRLNFGIAAETAKSRYGIPVETVYVADDVALDSGSNARGVAGTLLVHKAAGAAALLCTAFIAPGSGPRAVSRYSQAKKC